MVFRRNAFMFLCKLFLPFENAITNHSETLPVLRHNFGSNPIVLRPTVWCWHDPPTTPQTPIYFLILCFLYVLRPQEKKIKKKSQ